MNVNQRGFSSIQLVMAMGAIVTAAVMAVQFNSFLDRTRVGEAYRLAEESRVRIAEFYMLSDRFPSSKPEIEAVTTDILTPPDYVRDIVLERADRDQAVTLKIYLDNALADDGADATPFVYVAGSRPSAGSHGIEWKCGAQGIAADLLPQGCVVADS